jgi:pimeloyl-ACP methyl ester carboxylesterase
MALSFLSALHWSGTHDITLLLTALCQESCCRRYDRDVARVPPPGNLIDVGGFRLHLHCVGAGSPAVVFDAALGASSLSWALVQPEVARITRTCAYDRAGFAWSDGGPMPRTAGRVADELHELLQRAEIPPPYILVGHSFGGLVMRIFAARHREKTGGLVLVDPAHPEEWVEPGEHERRQIDRGARLCRHGATAARLGIARAVAAFVAVGALAPARGLVGLISRGGLSRADEEILAPIWKLPPEARRPLAQFWTEPKFFEALGSQIASICESAAEARDAGVSGLTDLPVTVITAATSSERRRQLHEALAKQSSRGRQLLAREGGHWVPLDQPAIVIDAIVQMVEMARRDGL